MLYFKHVAIFVQVGRWFCINYVPPPVPVPVPVPVLPPQCRVGLMLPQTKLLLRTPLLGGRGWKHLVIHIVCPTFYVNSHFAAFALPVSDPPPQRLHPELTSIALGPQNILIQPHPNGYCIQTRHPLIVGWEMGTAPCDSKLCCLCFGRTFCLQLQRLN